MTKEERKLEMNRQKTKDIGFELPVDDEEDDDDEDGIDNDFMDESEDEEAKVVKPGKKAKVDESMSGGEDSYSEEQDLDPPIQETKTLKQI